MWKYVMRVGGGHYCPPHYKSNAIQNLIRIIKKSFRTLRKPIWLFFIIWVLTPESGHTNIHKLRF